MKPDKQKNWLLKDVPVSRQKSKQKNLPERKPTEGQTSAPNSNRRKPSNWQLNGKQGWKAISRLSEPLWRT